MRKRNEKIEIDGSAKPCSVEIERRPSAWLPFSKVQKIFPGLPPKDLCNLVQLSSFAPSDVLGLVPKATSKQLGNFFEIVENCNQKIESCASVEPLLPEIKTRSSARLPFSRVQKIFSDVSAKDLCLLLDLSSYTPPAVLAVIPTATSKQLGDFFEIVEKTVCSQQHSKTTESSGFSESRAAETEKQLAPRLPLSRVQKIFPVVPTTTLCKLLELTSFEPSNIIALVPEATHEQLGSFFGIVQETMNVGGKKMQVVANRECQKSDAGETPAGVYSKIIDEIKVSMSNISSEQSQTLSFSNQFENKLLNILATSNPPSISEADNFKITFDKLRKNPLERSRLEKVHIARGHKYGIAHLGEKNWYQENLNLGNQLKTPSDRRKFRAGLKGDVDFINQMNMFDFEECLKSGNSKGLEILKHEHPLMTCELKNKLKEVSPIELIKFINEEKGNKILHIFDKIVSLAHFGQSMLDYFAHEDALEPALAVVCQILRQNENIGAVLKDRHTTFLGLAQPFQSLRSHTDRDCFGENSRTISRYNYRRKFSDRDTGRRREWREPYHRGFCNNFQKASRCSNINCRLIHKCVRCNSKNHGKSVCSRRNQ